MGSRLVCRNIFSWRLQTREEMSIHVQVQYLLSFLLTTIHVKDYLLPVLLLSFLLATIAWDNRMKDRIMDVSRPHDPIHLVPVHHLVQIPGQGAGDGAAPVTSWVDNWTLMV